MKPQPVKHKERTLTICFWLSFVMVIVNAACACTAPNDDVAKEMAQAAGVFAALAFVFWALAQPAAEDPP